MFAWILIGVIAIFIILAVLLIVIGAISGEGEFFGGAAGLIFISFIISLVLAIPWSFHANDLAKVTTQHHKVQVYENRIESLEQRLNNAQYPEKSVVSLDNDSPWATMMKELSKAETKLAQVRNERAEAIRSIEARKYGPMSGIVWFVGDIPEDIQKDFKGE